MTAIIDIQATLSEEERVILQRCEDVIDEGFRTFDLVGQAARTIRDRRLYREAYRTFEAYCEQRWGHNHSHIYRFIAAADTLQNLKSSPIGELLPTNEAQVRPLTALDPEAQREVWQEVEQAAQETGKPITAALVQQHVDARKPAPVPSEESVQSFLDESGEVREPHLGGADTPVQPDLLVDPATLDRLADANCCRLIAEGRSVKIVTHNGFDLVVTGSLHHQGAVEVDAYRAVLRTDFEGEAISYNQASGVNGPGSMFYHRVLVTSRGKAYVMIGPKITFQAQVAVAAATSIETPQSPDALTWIDDVAMASLQRNNSEETLHQGQIRHPVLINGSLWIMFCTLSANRGVQAFDAVRVREMDEYIESGLTVRTPLCWAHEWQAQVEAGKRNGADLCGLKVVLTPAPSDRSQPIYYVCTEQTARFAYRHSQRSAQPAPAPAPVEPAALAQPGLALAQPGLALAQPGLALAQPGLALAQPGLALAQPGLALAQPGLALAQPGLALAQPGLALAQPGLALAQPGLALAQPGLALAQPGLALAQPGLALAQPGLALAQPGLALAQPGLALAQPGLALAQPGLALAQPGLALAQPGLALAQPGLALAQPGLALAQPGLALAQPGLALAQPGLALAQPGLALAQPGLALAQPGLALAQPGLALAQPGLALAQPGLALAQPGLALAQPGLALAQPGLALAQPGLALAQPGLALAQPGLALAQPGLALAQPGLALAQPGLALAQPGLALAQPGLALAQPGLALAQPGLALAQPGLALAQPGLALAQPGLALAQPGLALAQPGLALAQPGLALAQPGLALAQPGLALAQPGLALAQPGLALAQPGLARASRSEPREPVEEPEQETIPAVQAVLDEMQEALAGVFRSNLAEELLQHFEPSEELWQELDGQPTIAYWSFVLEGLVEHIHDLRFEVSGLKRQVECLNSGDMPLLTGRARLLLEAMAKRPRPGQEGGTPPSEYLCMIVEQRADAAGLEIVEGQVVQR